MGLSRVNAYSAARQRSVSGTAAVCRVWGNAMRVGPIVPLLFVGLVLAPAFADEVPAGLVMSLSGSTSPPLAAMSEIPSASPLQLAAGTELTFLHYAKCKLITVAGGTLTVTRTEFVADGKILAERDGPCPRVHQLGANAPG